MIEQLDKCLRYKVCIAGIALALGLAGYLLLKPEPIAVQVPVAKVLRDLPTQTVTSQVQAYTPKAKKKLELPIAIQDNPDKVVLTATDLPKSKHERTVSTVLDISTGEAIQYVEEKPLALFAKESSGSLGAYAGFKGLEPTVRVQATQDLFTVKAVTFGAIAAVDVSQTGRTDTFIGIGGRLDW